MIEAHELTKRYGDKVAVQDLSFTVRPGVVTGFLGAARPRIMRIADVGLRDRQSRPTT